MTSYTYTKGFRAHFEGRTVVIPDQVAADQRAWDSEGRAFPALDRGGEILVKLDGEAYGLHTPGTGDPVCRRAD